MFTSSQADDVRVTTNITRDRGARNVPYHVMWARWVRLGRDKEDRELGCIEVPAPPFASVPKSNRRRAKVSGSWLPSVATCVLVWVALFLAHRRRESLSFRYPLFQDQDDLSAMRQDMRKSGRDPKDPNTTRPPRRILDLTGVDEHITTIKQDWMEVISSFMDETPVDSYRAETIRAHYNEDRNNVKRTCMLVSIQEGNVTFREEYKPNHHSRAHSVKYVLNKIMRERGSDLPGATFLVMVTDGHRPRVPTFGSARHWKNWKMLTPVPLGNYRGLRDAWGTPFKGWDRHVDENIRSTKDEFVWATKIPKAVFRGTLAMQRHKLGSCNEENSGRCEAATKWNQVNRGVMYEQAMMEPQLFDIAFTQHKPKEEADYQQFEGAPRPGNKMPFKDFQKYKYIINAGSNQDWAERLRSLLFTNSAVLYHMAETKEFFSPLMKPWIHFIPVSLHFEDLVRNIKWARGHDDFVRQIVRNQNAFANRYISERAMQQYWEIALEEFSARQAKSVEAPSQRKKEEDLVG